MVNATLFKCFVYDFTRCWDFLNQELLQTRALHKTMLRDAVVGGGAFWINFGATLGAKMVLNGGQERSGKLLTSR